VPPAFPFGPRAEVQGCAGVIAIHGASFSGSTLVNCVLGAHPSIFGGGELHWLVGDQSDPPVSVCTICGPDCRFWAERTRAWIRRDYIYHQVSRMFGRPFVVDSSKMTDWFERTLPHYPSLPVVHILMVKHPVRHVASFIEKTYGAEKWLLPDNSLDPVGVDSALFRLRSFYEECLLPGETGRKIKYNYVGAQNPARIDFVVRYEDFVASPAVALRPILARLGLEYHPRMASWVEAEHHHIGGNSGPLVQINDGKNSQNNEGPIIPTHEKKYRQQGIFLDNAYSDILDLDTIEKILGHPDALWMRERFGYGVPR